MSIVNVFIVKNNILSSIQMGLRPLEIILEKDKPFEKLFLMGSKKYLDEGFIIADLDNKVLLNAQLGLIIEKGDWNLIENY